jgi:hypothetical protein
MSSFNPTYNQLSGIHPPLTGGGTYNDYWMSQLAQQNYGRNANPLITQNAMVIDPTTGRYMQVPSQTWGGTLTTNPIVNTDLTGAIQLEQQIAQAALELANYQEVAGAPQQAAEAGLLGGNLGASPFGGPITSQTQAALTGGFLPDAAGVVALEGTNQMGLTPEATAQALANGPEPYASWGVPNMPSYTSPQGGVSTAMAMTMTAPAAAPTVNPTDALLADAAFGQYSNASQSATASASPVPTTSTASTSNSLVMIPQEQLAELGGGGMQQFLDDALNDTNEVIASTNAAFDQTMVEAREWEAAKAAGTLPPSGGSTGSTGMTQGAGANAAAAAQLAQLEMMLQQLAAMAAAQNGGTIPPEMQAMLADFQQMIQQGGGAAPISSAMAAMATNGATSGTSTPLAKRPIDTATLSKIQNANLQPGRTGTCVATVARNLDKAGVKSFGPTGYPNTNNSLHAVTQLATSGKWQSLQGSILPPQTVNIPGVGQATLGRFTQAEFEKQVKAGNIPQGAVVAQTRHGTEWSHNWTASGNDLAILNDKGLFNFGQSGLDIYGKGGSVIVMVPAA